jgi:phenylpyruvate tautomerase PptA (4-oxalocrotonate tautomerase family)
VYAPPLPEWRRRSYLTDDFTIEANFMPLVRISLLKGKSREYVRAIADGVQRALVEAFEVPPDDRFQIIEQLDPENLIYDPDYLGVRRTSDVVFIHILASNWRNTGQKQRLYAAIADNLAKDPGLRREDVQIILAPNTREDWSFGRGEASYVKD